MVCIHESANAFLPNIVARACAWDIYREALAVQERKKWPTVGAAIDRRIFAYTSFVYSDVKIKAHICYACAGIFPNANRIHSEIMIRRGEWLFSLSNKCLRDHFSWASFRQRYAAPGSPLHPLGAQDCDGANADYKKWVLRLHPDYETIEASEKEPYLLCCPEDHSCKHGCQTLNHVCPECEFTICRE